LAQEKDGLAVQYNVLNEDLSELRSKFSLKDKELSDLQKNFDLLSQNYEALKNSSIEMVGLYWYTCKKRLL